jgi:2-phospho-L-lactate guanylyltransferase
MNAILVPAKALNDAKGRLAASLSPDERHRLGLAMLSDVLIATVPWRSWVVTSDVHVWKLAEELGCELVDDGGAELNESIRLGTRVASAAGATALLVLPADVPLVEADDVSAAFETGSAVAVAPSADGGTNALVRRPPDVIEPLFGPGSARRHFEIAERAGITVDMLELESLVLDVDQNEDLIALASTDSKRDSVLLARELLSRA